MVKRSPILGYNHNVRYRGLVFHVQTEDSGVLSPHLFTHLFHSGVIVSTRKLVYDSGSAEEAIKALMQAQHKAVLKELKRGQFDDKIDQYLGGTPGLLPRDAGEDGGEDRTAEPAASRASHPAVPVDAPVRAQTDLTEAELALSREPTIEEPAIGQRPTEHDVDARIELAARLATVVEPPPDDEVTTATEDLDSQPEILIQLELDDSDDHARPRRIRDALDASMLSDGIPGALPFSTAPSEKRASTAVGAASLPPARPITRPPSRPAMVPPQVVSRPLPPEDRRSQNTDAIEVYAPPPPSASELPVFSAAAAAALAASAPAAGGPERPGQYSQHKKISTRIPEVRGEGPRPLHPQQGTVPTITAPPRPGTATGAPATAPPARPGVTAPLPRSSTASPTGTPPVRATPMPAAVAAAGAAAAAAQRSAPVSVPAPARPAPPAPGTLPRVSGDPRSASPSRPTPIPIPSVRSSAANAAVATADTTKTPTAAAPRVPMPVATAPTAPAAQPPMSATQPIQSRTSSVSSGAGVVMTRPAVIVGAPAKPATTTQRIRKAREDEGRGFGQGLISEKSLDEVILAYLSEDAEDNK